ncbi:MAG: ABC-2 family transporter protein [Deltaproteobacteria bacterium]|nr:ABC-2 family transporter protein [Deltaproteobacteria bacterium]
MSALEPLRLYGRYFATSIRSQLQYRASVVMLTIGHLLMTGVEFFGMWALFDRFGHLQQWRLAEVALLYGMANIAFAISEAVGRGFKAFGQMVRKGDFDRLLLRPRGTAFQVCAQHFELVRLGRLLQGLAVLGYAIVELGLLDAGSRLLLLLTAIIGGACVFTGLFILQATTAFWTVESLEIFATVTYGGVETTQYPMSIYRDGFRSVFTFVVPLVFVNYVPGLAILGRPQTIGPWWLAWISPLIGLAFLLLCLRLWRLGVRHYRSTGS